MSRFSVCVLSVFAWTLTFFLASASSEHYAACTLQADYKVSVHSDWKYGGIFKMEIRTSETFTRNLSPGDKIHVSFQKSPDISVNGTVWGPNLNTDSTNTQRNERSFFSTVVVYNPGANSDPHNFHLYVKVGSNHRRVLRQSDVSHIRLCLEQKTTRAKVSRVFQKKSSSYSTCTGQWDYKVQVHSDWHYGGIFKVDIHTNENFAKKLYQGQKIEITLQKSPDISVAGTLWGPNFYSDKSGSEHHHHTYYSSVLLYNPGAHPDPYNFHIYLKVASTHKRKLRESDISHVRICQENEEDDVSEDLSDQHKKSSNADDHSGDHLPSNHHYHESDSPHDSFHSDEANFWGKIKAFDSCGSKRRVAITFDDAPLLRYSETSTLLSILKRIKLASTFYMSPMGDGDGSPDSMRRKCDLVAEILADGHYIGCHSWTHADFTQSGKSNEELYNTEIQPCKDWIRECSGGKYEVTQFRPPYGRLTRQQAEYLSSEFGYIIALWTMDGDDWMDGHANDYRKSKETVENWMNSYGPEKPNSVVIVLHDENQYENFDAETGKHFLEWIQEYYGGDYEFVTADKCWEECDTIDYGGVCRDSYKTHHQIISWNL